ncbi:MAG: flagellar FlbD family protein [Oscillospiraceae bacterium]|nr:flagellar FlbD family protein [Oscillospiraceae bacterium]
MIKVRKLSKEKEEFYINPSLIETVEMKPDTIVTLINGKKYIVSDTVEELLGSVENYYKIVGVIPPQIIFNSYDFGGASEDSF